MEHKLTSLKCAYCHELFQFFSSTRHCGKCNAIFHDTCWYAQPVCPIYGCSGNLSAEDRREKQTDRLIGIVYIVTIALFFVLSGLLESHIYATGALFVLSSLFWFSYFKPERSFLFRAVRRFSREFAWVERPEWYALFYAVLFFLMGFISLLVGSK